MIIKEFGAAAITDEQGKINREKLGEVIFSNPDKRRMLNRLSHPRILKRIIALVWRLKFIEKKPLVVLDAPLLFESRVLEYFCYPIIVVYIENGQIQQKRLMERNNLTEQQAMLKISAQMPTSLKVKKADVTIENGCSPKYLHNQVINKAIPLVCQQLGYLFTSDEWKELR